MMGLDAYITKGKKQYCKHCGKAFPDVTDYVCCDCGEHWCSEECVVADGHIDESDLPPVEGYYVDSSCNYCRGEDFDEHELLEYVYRRYMTKEQLIESYKKDYVRFFDDSLCGILGVNK